MPFGGIVTPRDTRVVGGMSGPPWLQRQTGPVELARTYDVVVGPQLLRVVDAEPPAAPPATGRSLGSSPQVPVPRRRR
jgi:hypothetical protein